MRKVAEVERDDARDRPAERGPQHRPRGRQGVHVDDTNLVPVVGDQHGEFIGAPRVGGEGQRGGRGDAPRGGPAHGVVPHVDDLHAALLRGVEHVVSHHAALGADGYQLQRPVIAVRFKRQTPNRASRRVRLVFPDKVECTLGFLLLGRRRGDRAVELEDGDASTRVGGGGVGTLLVVGARERRHRILAESHRLDVNQRTRVQRLQRPVARAHQDTTPVVPVAHRGGLGPRASVR